jgi:hypothetical protein
MAIIVYEFVFCDSGSVLITKYEIIKNLERCIIFSWCLCRKQDLLSAVSDSVYGIEKNYKIIIVSNDFW